MKTLILQAVSHYSGFFTHMNKFVTFLLVEWWSDEH